MSDPAYTEAVDALLDLIRSHDLPNPTSIRWDTYPRPHLEVTVDAPHFRAWNDAVLTSHVKAENTEKYRHMHIYGWYGPGPVKPHRILILAHAKLTDTDTAEPTEATA